MHLITCMMLESLKCGEEYPGSLPHLASGLLNFWIEMLNYLIGYFKEDQRCFG